MNSRLDFKAGSINVHRVLSTIVRTALAAMVVTVPFTFSGGNRYRCSSKLLLESTGSPQPVSEGSSPLHIGSESASHSIQTQVQMLQGARLVTDTCRDADVPPGAITLDAHQVGGTDVVELLVESPQSSYAERFAKALPNTYLQLLNGRRRSELANAIQYGDSRLRDNATELSLLERKTEELTKAGASRPALDSVANEIEMKRKESLRLVDDLTDLKLVLRLMHDPVAVISPAEHAIPASSPKGGRLLLGLAIGLVAGAIVAAINATQHRKK